MRISKTVYLGEREVDVHVTSEDLRQMFSEETGEESAHNIMVAINDTASFYKGIPNEKIAAMSDVARATIYNFLAEQATRFLPR